MKQRLTFQEHLAVARELNLHRHALEDMYIKLGARFPANVAEDPLRRADRHINAARSRLEDAMFRDCKAEVLAWEQATGRNACDIYYGDAAEGAT